MMRTYFENTIAICYIEAYAATWILNVDVQGFSCNQSNLKWSLKSRKDKNQENYDMPVSKSTLLILLTV